MTKAYIINLTFNTWQNQVWFTPTNDTENGRIYNEDFEKAEKTLDEIGNNCASSNEFFSKAVEHFESYGFSRIQK